MIFVHVLRGATAVAHTCVTLCGVLGGFATRRGRASHPWPGSSRSLLQPHIVVFWRIRVMFFVVLVAFCFFLLRKSRPTDNEQFRSLPWSSVIAFAVRSAGSWLDKDAEMMLWTGAGSGN